MNHKYSSYILIFLLIVIGGTVIVNSLDELGMNNVWYGFNVFNNVTFFKDINLTQNISNVYSLRTVIFNSTVPNGTGNISEWNFTSMGGSACINIASANDGLGHAGGQMSMCSLNLGETKLVFGGNRIQPAGGYWNFYDGSVKGIQFIDTAGNKGRFVVNTNDTIIYNNFTIANTSGRFIMYASDNISAKMCISTTQAGIVSAVAC